MSEDIVNNSQSTMIIATAGHVDHGKTALVKHLTGTNTDTLAEEKDRGLTINLGYAYHHFTAGPNNDSAFTLGFVDVPGHTDFINNMLAGVGSVQFALLIVAADDGIMPQTREHLAVLDLMGIKQGAIALTKIDRADENQLSRVTRSIEELLEKTSLAKSPIFPVSNISAEGIEELQRHLETSVASIDTQESAKKRKPRYLIDRSFNAKGIGTIVTGAVRDGELKVGDSLLHSQSNQVVRIKSMRLDEDDIEVASAGQRVAANISIDQKSIARGDWLMDPSLANPINRIDVQLTLLDSSTQLKNHGDYHLFIGASHRLVSIRCLDEASSIFQLKLNESLQCNFGDRFVIRDPASTETLGGGKVLDTFVPRKQRSSAERLSYLKSLDTTDQNALAELLEHQSRGVSIDNFAKCRNIGDTELSTLMASCAESSVSISLENAEHPTLLSKSTFSQYQQQILGKMTAHHLAHPTLQGLNTAALSTACSLPGSFQLFEGIIGQLITEKKLKLAGTLLHLPSHSTRLSREEEEFLAKVRPLLSKSGNVPPRTRELVEITGIDLASLERILKQSVKSGNLIAVAANRHYLPETILKLAEFTEALAESTESEEGFSVIQFRDQTGIGRNLCIEILEYFDSVGFTRRDGNSRFVRTAKENVFS